jgi:hypothetical protein
VDRLTPSHASTTSIPESDTPGNKTDVSVLAGIDVSAPTSKETSQVSPSLGMHENPLVKEPLPLDTVITSPNVDDLETSLLEDVQSSKPIVPDTQPLTITRNASAGSPPKTRLECPYCGEKPAMQPKVASSEPTDPCPNCAMEMHVVIACAACQQEATISQQAFKALDGKEYKCMTCASKELLM